MRKAFSRSWLSSKQPRKQRKYRYNAPLHIRHKFLGSHLSKELRQKHDLRSIEIIQGDKIKVMRGQFRKKEGKVERVDMKKSKVYVTGIETIKKDGSKSLYPLTPSNLMLLELNLDDKKRLKKKQQKQKKEEEKKENKGE
ncbi:MAG: 50S ribosomal protein L24 [Nanoarchaeota archaeon]|nr:50S ribosomal protein L24 [Nanoarchaeota archaeon]